MDELLTKGTGQRIKKKKKKVQKKESKKNHSSFVIQELFDLFVYSLLEAGHFFPRKLLQMVRSFRSNQKEEQQEGGTAA